MNAALAVLAAIVVAGAVRALTVALPSMRHVAAGHAAPADELAGDLGRLELTVDTATTHAGSLHTRLRPILREIAADGLRRRGVDLDADPAAAQAVLAPATWELVRPDRPRPDDPFAPGLAPTQLDAVLSDLEGLLP